MKSVKVLPRFSNELARQSVVALDAALKQRLVRDVAATLNKQLFSASGGGIATPKGMLPGPARRPSLSVEPSRSTTCTTLKASSSPRTSTRRACVGSCGRVSSSRSARSRTPPAAT